MVEDIHARPASLQARAMELRFPRYNLESEDATGPEPTIAS
jgi:hypothetical protein